ncbi:amidase signature domain-containing protein [Aspergillus multicolor]|uniref:amidase signature domain-containing protein n=1 Tax=Aspergillus multicolor TaxID=41759 RepID=UPI003CCDF669
MRFGKIQSPEIVPVAVNVQACVKCEKRGTTVHPFKRCAKCSTAWYCSRQCQTADWKTHKKVCGRNSAERLNPFIRPRSLVVVIEKPYHKLQTKTWLHDRPYDDVYKLLIDTYRLRMYNQWSLTHQADEDSIYAPRATDGYAGFSRFLELVDRRCDLLPDDWSYSDVVDCVNYGLRNEWSSLNCKVNETSIFAYYGSQSIVAELKIFAWQIYGWDITGSLTPSTLKALVLDLFKTNTLTVEQYAKSLLDRIKERDIIVRAWAYLDPELVLEKARALERISYDERGPLHEIAIGIKGIANTKGIAQHLDPHHRYQSLRIPSYGRYAYTVWVTHIHNTGHQSRSDSSAVAILRDAGALIFGKTTTTEFTVTSSGPSTTNPHDAHRTPGGSSCGSAAAVADFQVTLSLGAQTGGSVIRPASYTGVFAMKPTHNAVSLEGKRYSRLASILSLLAGVFSIEDDEIQAGLSTAAAIDKAVAILQNRGVQVEEVPFPPELCDAQALRRTQKVIMSSEGQKVDKARLAPEICAMVENTAKYTNAEPTEALDTLAQWRVVINDLAENYTVILAPSAVDEAPLGLEDMESAIFNTVWTGFHMPVINIPAFMGAHDMPVSVSLVAPRFRGQHLLRIGKIVSEAFMAEGGWRIDLSA